MPTAPRLQKKSYGYVAAVSEITAGNMRASDREVNAGCASATGNRRAAGLILHCVQNDKLSSIRLSANRLLGIAERVEDGG
jgi:hypothetical protein